MPPLKPLHPQVQSNHKLARGLVGAFPFQIGGNLMDASRNGRHGTGTVGSFTQYAHSPYGSNWSFDTGTSTGSGNAITGMRGMTISASLPFACTAWARADADHGVMTLVSQADGGGTGRIWMSRHGTDRISTALGTGSHSTDGPATATLSEWHLYAMSYNPATGNVQLSLNAAAYTNVARTIETCSGDFVFGANKGIGVSWGGLIAEIRIWNRQLSIDDLRSMYFDPWGLYRQKEMIYVGVTIYNETAEGGCVIGESFPVSKEYSNTGEGGCEVGGEAYGQIVNETATGGLVVGETSAEQAEYNEVNTGGCVIGGEAYGQSIDETAEGGCVIGETFPVFQSYNETATGGLVVGETSAEQAEYNSIATGGGLLGTTFPTTATYNHVATGGLFNGETGPAWEVDTIVATGGCVLGGPLPYANGFDYRRSITIPAGAVSTDLNSFVLALVVDNVGSDVVQVEDVDDNILPHEVAAYEDNTVHVFAKCDLVAASDNTFYLYYT